MLSKSWLPKQHSCNSHFFQKNCWSTQQGNWEESSASSHPYSIFSMWLCTSLYFCSSSPSWWQHRWDDTEQPSNQAEVRLGFINTLRCLIRYGHKKCQNTSLRHSDAVVLSDFNMSKITIQGDFIVCLHSHLFTENWPILPKERRFLPLVVNSHCFAYRAPSQTG